MIYFKTVLVKTNDSSATAVFIPDDLVKKIDSKKRIPVQITIDGIVYRSTITFMSGRFLVPVNKKIRDQIKKYGGEQVTVEIKKDLEKRDVTIPVEMKKILIKSNVYDSFRSLSFTQRKEYVNSIIDAKKEETKQRRLVKLINALKK